MFKLSQDKQTIFKISIIVLCIALAVFSPVAYVLVVTSPSNVNFTVPCTINTYGAAWSGALGFNLDITNTTAAQAGNYLVIMDTDGNLLDLRDSSGPYGVAYNIAPDTVLFQGEPHVDGPGAAPTYATHIWNLTSGATVDFPNVIGHHDIQFNPVDYTFLILQDYVRQVGNSSIFFDKIVQSDPNGNILWSWDTYDHIPLSQSSTFNETAVVGNQTVQDFSHANSLDWDYTNGIIYLNLRHTNTFYKIDQNSGNIIWACGEFGNFTLIGDNGQPATSLWYHSHDTKQIAPNVFTMFDNDNANITNPNNCRSRMIELTVNETNMTAYVNWSWEAPTQYWNSYAGGTTLLPNGDYLGCFGDPTHQFPQNRPWNFVNTGAVLVEVNPSGQVVKTFTFPVGCYIYRVEIMNNPTPGNFVTPVPIPAIVTESPSATPVPTTLSSSTTPNPTQTLTQIPTQTQTPVATPTPSLKPTNSNITQQTEIALIFVSIIVAIILLSLGFYRSKNAITSPTR